MIILCSVGFVDRKIYKYIIHEAVINCRLLISHIYKQLTIVEFFTKIHVYFFRGFRNYTDLTRHLILVKVVEHGY